MTLRGVMTPGTGSRYGGTTTTVALPGGCQPGDYAVVLAMEITGAATSIGIPGWADLHGGDGSDRTGGNNNTTAVMGKTLDAGDIAAGDATVSSDVYANFAAVGIVWAGADSPVIAHVYSDVSPQVTTVAAGSPVFLLAAYRTNATSTLTAPSGYTLDSSTRAGNENIFGIAHLDAPGPAGSYGGVAFGITAGWRNVQSYTLALAPTTEHHSGGSLAVVPASTIGT
ncbi:MAG: hypothetical protein ACRDQA_16070, partial [Nocardioidaceae bacterium]